MRLGAALGALAILLAACDEDVVSPATGALEVRISGLPAGAGASATVTGPGAYSQAVTTTTTLSDLALGTYTIAASEVTAADSRWTPTPATQDREITAASRQALAEIAYAVATARLAVTITGLPNGVDASVTVTGPGGYTNVLTSSAAINLLTPGAYTITAADVVSGGSTYRPAPTTQTIQLPASTTQVAATVVYSVGTGSLTVTVTGLGTGINAAVQVTGPSGYNQQLTGTQTLTPLPPGTYTIAAAAVASNLTTHTPAPATQNVNVAIGATATGTVTYTGAPLGLSVQEISMGLTNPVYLTTPANDPRLFIVEQLGRIRVYKNGALLPTPFLDITTIVRDDGSEEGLLSVAFDPAYATNGRFYVYHNDMSGNIAVARYTATPASDVADANSRQPVITIPHPGQSNHNGGLAMFGPDGMLYLGIGDGGGGGDPLDNAQNVNSLLGKLLRLNVSSLPYTIPAGNPFVGITGADEIWAYGLRNPWRYAFDPPANQLYIADVGQNAWEEVNAASSTAPGLNYGWRITEGTHCYPSPPCNTAGQTLPVVEYSHSEGCSITGGFVYRGQAIPELTGHYLYSDFCTGFLRSFRYSGGQVLDQRTWPIGNIGNITSFGRDAAGELYMLSNNGRAYRVVKQ